MNDAGGVNLIVNEYAAEPIARGQQFAFGLVAIALVGCLLASLLLVLTHFGAVELPGCGTASDCTRAAESRWGQLPGTDWPLSFVGFAYFQALTAAYIYSGGRLSTVLRVVMAAGALASVVLTVVMFAERYVCGYCLAIHALNIALAVGYELGRRLTGPTAVRNPIATTIVFIVTFVATSLLLAILDHRSTVSAEQERAHELEQALCQAAVAGTAVKEAFGPGRYFWGADSAKVHVTIVSDYQCPSCRTIDAQLRAMTAGRSDVSISARHFPFCTDCNEHIDKTRHSNACRAALAAEAAGKIGGVTAFWRMHDWLFARRGEFTDDELHQFVKEMGLNSDRFLAAMQDDATIEVIRTDTTAADSAGLRFTPMTFINGRSIDIGQ